MHRLIPACMLAVSLLISSVLAISFLGAPAVAHGQPHQGEEVGYSSGVEAPGSGGMHAPMHVPIHAPDPNAPQDTPQEAQALPAIILDVYRQDAPPAAPVPPALPSDGPVQERPSVPDSFPEPAPREKSAPRAQTPPNTAPSPAPSAAPAPAPAAPLAALPAAGPPSAFIMSMLQATLQEHYAKTIAASQTPARQRTAPRNNKIAQQFNDVGKDLINNKNNPPEAIEAFLQAYTYDPTNSEIVGNLGFALYRNGNLEQARTVLMESLELRPGYSASWFVLGQVFDSLQRYDLAYASFVNTCLFSRNIKTSIKYVEQQAWAHGEQAGRDAATRALRVCRMQADGSPPQAQAPQAQARSAPVPPPPVSPPGASQRIPPPRLAVVDVGSVVQGYHGMAEIYVKMRSYEHLPKQQQEAKRKELLAPLITRFNQAVQQFARNNGFQLVIESRKESRLRQGATLTAADFVYPDPEKPLLDYLNSNDGKTYRRNAQVTDITAQIASMVNRK